MSTITVTPVIVEELYRVPQEKVWNALTNPSEMKQWFFETIDSFVPETGFETSFDVVNEGKIYQHLWKVLETVPNSGLTLEWKYGGYPGASRVTIELMSGKEGTRLRLTHEGLETFPADNPDFSRENCNNGWNYIIKERLKGYLEGK